MTLDSTHPARKFEGEFRLKSSAAPAIPVPADQPDTLKLLALLTGGKATLTLTVGAQGGSRIRLDGGLRCGGAAYTLFGSFIDPGQPTEATGTLVILKPRQQVRFRATLTDTGLTLTPGFDDGADHWVQAFRFARHVSAPARQAPRAPSPPPPSLPPAAARSVPAPSPPNPDELMMKEWTDRLAGAALAYKTNSPDSDYSGGSTYYERQIVITLARNKIFALDDQSFSRISSAGMTLSKPSRTKKTGFWRIAVSTKDQPLLVLSATGEDEMLYVLSVRNRTLHLDGKPWELTRR